MVGDSIWSIGNTYAALTISTADLTALIAHGSFIFAVLARSIVQPKRAEAIFCLRAVTEVLLLCFCFSGSRQLSRVGENLDALEACAIISFRASRISEMFFCDDRRIRPGQPKDSFLHSCPNSLPALRSAWRITGSPDGIGEGFGKWRAMEYCNICPRGQLF